MWNINQLRGTLSLKEQQLGEVKTIRLVALSFCQLQYLSRNSIPHHPTINLG